MYGCDQSDCMLPACLPACLLAEASVRASVCSVRARTRPRTCSCAWVRTLSIRPPSLVLFACLFCLWNLASSLHLARVACRGLLGLGHEYPSTLLLLVKRTSRVTDAAGCCKILMVKRIKKISLDDQWPALMVTLLCHSPCSRSSYTRCSISKCFHCHGPQRLFLTDM